MPDDRPLVVHADESCLGNGSDGRNPGGAGALLEVASKGGIVRRDVYISAPDTTNNRMALCGAIAVFALLAKKGQGVRVLFISDSQYLVKGMADWLPAWKARGWRRKGGKIENLELWQMLDRTSSVYEARWEWVRGHAEDPKNEYADRIAVRSATEQLQSDGAISSGFLAWLREHQAKGLFTDYDPDRAFAQSVATLENTA